MECISAHPEVGGYGEVLLKGVEGWSDWPKGARDRPFYTTYLKDRNADGTFFKEHLLLFRYLDYLYAPRRQFRAIGFKLMYDQVRRHPEVIAYLLRRRVRIVHLFRQNVLDIYLSREALLRRKFAHARSPAERESIRLRLNPERTASELHRLWRHQQTARHAVRLSGLPAHNVIYEEGLADTAVLHDTLRFLGITSWEGVDLSPTMLKLAPSSHRDTIENFTEVAGALAGSDFARFLRD